MARMTGSGNIGKSNDEVEVNLLSTQDGNIVFTPDVIATIAGVAALSVKGVAGMSGGIVDGIVEVLGIKNFKKGVKAEIGREETAVSTSIVVEYGANVQSVSVDVQKVVKEAIETMTGLRVVTVNVLVQAVKFGDVKSADAAKLR